MQMINQLKLLFLILTFSMSSMVYGQMKRDTSHIRSHHQIQKPPHKKENKKDFKKGMHADSLKPAEEPSDVRAVPHKKVAEKPKEDARPQGNSEEEREVRSHGNKPDHQRRITPKSPADTGTMQEAREDRPRQKTPAEIKKARSKGHVSQPCPPSQK
jgi:hypothetical protein